MYQCGLPNHVVDHEGSGLLANTPVIDTVVADNESHLGTVVCSCTTFCLFVRLLAIVLLLLILLTPCTVPMVNGWWVGLWDHVVWCGIVWSVLILLVQLRYLRRMPTTGALAGRNKSCRYISVQGLFGYFDIHQYSHLFLFPPPDL